MMKLIPVTILTGFLGAGKTTVLKRILSEQHGHKIAVIENEFGAESIDNDILMSGGAEEIVEMNNGCLCCTIRGDLAEALMSLALRRASKEIDFERVIIETTGIALPDPIAQTFFLDPDVGQHYMLDAVITVVDAYHAMQQLDRQTEAQSQIGFADCLLISKADLTDDAMLQAVMNRIQKINVRAPLITLNTLTFPLQQILDIRGFNLNDRFEINPDLLDNQPQQTSHSHQHGHDHHDGHGHHHEHSHHDGHEHHDCCSHMPDLPHQDEISSFAFRDNRPFDTNRLNDFLGSVIRVYSQDMLRYKGVLYLGDNESRVVFQGVRELMGTDLGAPWKTGEERCSKIVFIGRNLPRDIILQGLNQCLIDTEEPVFSLASQTLQEKGVQAL